MEEILIYLLKSAGVLSIFVMIYHFLLRRLTFFKSNRWFLLLGMIASIGFPFVEIEQVVYVEQTVPVLTTQQQLEIPVAMALQAPPQEPLIDPNQLLLMLYVAVSLFFLGKMAVELLSLRRLIRSGKVSYSDGFKMVSLSRKVTPFSFFKTICFYYKDQDKAGMDLILQHEKVHAREWHSIDLLLTHLYRAVFWINPLAWMIKRQVGENLEFIADATAKVQNNTGISYERTLLSSAASHMQPALANNFFTPFIKKRIQMLQKETSKKWNAYKYALILPVIVLFMYSFNVVEKVEYIKKSKIEATEPSGKSELYVFDTSTVPAYYTDTATKINVNTNYTVNILPKEKGGSSFGLIVAFDNQSNPYVVTVPITSKNIGGTFLEAFDDSLIVYDRDFNKLFVFDRNGMTSNLQNESLIFDITAATSQAELDSYKKKVNKFADYNVAFEEDIKEGKSSTNISVVFKNPKNDGAMISYPKGFTLKLLAGKEELKIVNEEKGSINTVSREGLGFERLKKEYDISSSTSKEDLDTYVKQINEFANYKIKLEKSKDENGKSRLSVSTAFNGKAFDKNIVIPIYDADKGLVFLRVTKNQLKVNEDSSNNTYLIDESAHLKITTEDWTYGKTTLSKNKPVFQSDKIKFTIPPTATEESLERIKTQLKSEYNVDFDYSKLKYKDGKIIRLKITLDDNRGYKGTQDYNNNEKPIPTICINGQIDENKKSWSMGSCGEQGMSFNIPEVPNVPSVPNVPNLPKMPNINMDSIFGSIQNLNLTRMNLAISEIDMNSLQKTLKELQADLADMEMDEISEDLKARLKEAEKQLGSMNFDSMKFTNPKVRYNIAGNARFIPNDSTATYKDIWAYEDPSDNGSPYGGTPPLVMLNGVESSLEVIETLAAEHIESVSVLKDKAATSLYGNKAKNGVIIFTTKAIQKKKSKNKPVHFSSDGVSLGAENNFLKIYTPSTIEGLRGFTSTDDPYIFVDSKRISESQFDQLDPKKIKLVNILNRKLAIEKYGENAANGAVEIILKSASELKMSEDELQDKMFPKKNKTNSNISRSYSTTTSSSSAVESFTVTIDDFTDEEMEKFKNILKKNDIDFKLRTFRKTNGQLTKLKFDLDEIAYTYAMSKPIKSLTISKNEKGINPQVTYIE